MILILIKKKGYLKVDKE